MTPRWYRTSAHLAALFVLLVGVRSGEALAGASPADLSSGAVRHLGKKAPSPEEIELGERLFFDKRLSLDGTIACATCHDPEHGFSDRRALPVGVAGKPLKRHPPHLYNLAWSRSFFWDGRAESLEEQALMPIQNPDEMGLSLEELVKRLQDVGGYVERFDRLYGHSEITPKNIAKAISAFERTLIADDTPYDRYLAGDKTALSVDARAGMELFQGKAKCVSCHSGPNLTDGKFHNTGVVGDDPGRSELDRVGEFRMTPYPFFHTQKAFKTAGLRNVALIAPYMHNGSLDSLTNVVRFYNRGGSVPDSYGLSFEIHPLGLTEAEMQQLVAFLESLTSPLTVVPPEPLGEMSRLVHDPASPPSGNQ